MTKKSRKAAKSRKSGSAGLSRVKTIDLYYHPNQDKVFHDLHRFKVLFCGRRWGKTRGAIQWLVENVLGGRNRLGWWVSPTYRQAKIAYRYFRKIFFRSGIFIKDNKTELTVSLILGGRLEFRSSEIPDNLRGEGVDKLVLDECGMMAEQVWSEVIRPTLMDSRGDAIFIGTPKGGQHWFTELWNKGQDANEKEWKSWRFSTYDNPYIDTEEIKKAEEEMPELTARQEIYAEAIDTGGSVFRNVEELGKLKPEAPKPDETYTLGVDLAKYRDFTVLIVRRENVVVHMDRFNKIDWTIQKDRIINTARLYNNARVLIDSTGVGDPIFEDLNRAGLSIEPYQINYQSKRELIDNLILRFDKKQIQILDEPILKNELKAYAYELTSGGRLRTNAPSGKQDDCVIALALAFWGEDNIPSQFTIINHGGRFITQKNF